MSKTNLRTQLRLKRKYRVKNQTQKDPQKLRLTVFRSLNHIYAQIIDDSNRKTLAAASSLSQEFKAKMKTGGNVEAARLVGSLLGEKAAANGVKEVYYDRNGFIYAGRVKALAEAVREKGIKF
ncbi:50S ribosomal protein L18 [Nitrospina watsonii]|uniref:Large ribosomal subunit protein uL18 n=1 Tax=Nitrospina watsonii TaxID=1323948 RepID=A0ABM9HGL1_9BACT|nr:50S ribosomal protein L18 [Nitrospina watsonii]CAI2719423.1 50S ribosomal subunit protein L18 [Nitrospina watsonii]